MPFRQWSDLRDEEVEAKVPSKYYHLAVVLKRCPEYWREPGFVKLEADVRLEAIITTQIETVLSMVRARTHLIDRCMSGAWGRDDEVDERHPDAAPGAVAADADLVYDAKQEIFDKEARKQIHCAHATHACDDDDEKLDDLREERRAKAGAIGVTSQPGCGETHRAKLLIHYTCEKGFKVLFTFPTGPMQSRHCAELQRESTKSLSTRATAHSRCIRESKTHWRSSMTTTLSSSTSSHSFHKIIFRAMGALRQSTDASVPWGLPPASQHRRHERQEQPILVTHSGVRVPSVPSFWRLATAPQAQSIAAEALHEEFDSAWP